MMPTRMSTSPTAGEHHMLCRAPIIPGHLCLLWAKPLIYQYSRFPTLHIMRALSRLAHAGGCLKGVPLP